MSYQLFKLWQNFPPNQRRIRRILSPLSPKHLSGNVKFWYMLQISKNIKFWYTLQKVSKNKWWYMVRTDRNNVWSLLENISFKWPSPKAQSERSSCKVGQKVRPRLFPTSATEDVPPVREKCEEFGQPPETAFRGEIPMQPLCEGFWAGRLFEDTPPDTYRGKAVCVLSVRTRIQAARGYEQTYSSRAQAGPGDS
jgi:hypothetical protein